MTPTKLRIQIWANRLSLPLLLWILVQFGAKRPVIRAAKMTRCCSVIVAAVRRLAASGSESMVRLVDVQMGEIGPDGFALNINLESRIIKFAVALAGRQSLFVKCLPADESENADLWSKIYKSHFMAYNRSEISFLIYAENQIMRHCRPAEKTMPPVCYLTLDVKSSALDEAIEQSSRIPMRVRRWLSLRNAVSMFVILPGRPSNWLRRIVRSAVNPQWQPAVHVDEAAIAKGIILQQHAPDATLRYPSAGQLYWLEGSDVSPVRVALYFNRPGEFGSPDYRAGAEALGVNWIDASHVTDYLEHPIRDMLGCLKEARSVFKVKAPGQAAWRFKILARHLILMKSYQAIFSRLNVLAVKQTWVFLPETLAQLIAARKQSVIHIWNYWSIAHYMSDEASLGVADLILAWGPLQEGYVKVAGFDFAWILQVGMIQGDGLESDDEDSAKRLRQELGDGAEFVIAALDTSFGPTTHSHRDHVLDFYKSIVILLEKQPRWACIVKPKSSLANLDLPDDLSAAINRLEKEGRWLEQVWAERISVAARASDLVVCSSINTAGFAAAVAGRRVLHLDLAGIAPHPIVIAGGTGKVVFNTVESFSSAIERVAGGDKELGDHGPWRDLIDPFNDNKGRYRAGQVIKQYLDGRDTGLSARDALDSAAMAYQAKYGAEAVSNPNDGIETIGMDLWARSKRISDGEASLEEVSTSRAGITEERSPSSKIAPEPTNYSIRQ